LSEKSQKAFLQDAKRRLLRQYPDLTWDRFATLAEIEPRTLKTYRMPEGTTGYRAMPRLVRGKIEALVRGAEAVEISVAGGSEIAVPPSRSERASFEVILVPALAALVIRQARLAVIDGRPVLGTDRYAGDQVGLTREDRHAMALVSRAQLRHGQRDIGAEIHELLFACTKPLGDWLPLASIHAERLSQVVLLDPEEGVPTREADELAQRFVSTTASIEEQLFSRFREQLAKGSRIAASAAYTRVREFVVRHPIATRDELAGLTSDLPSTISVLLNQEFYEPVPESWGSADQLTICAHCRNAIQSTEAGRVCRTRACAESLPVHSGRGYSLQESLRLTRGLRQYWQEPGFDEVRVFDELLAAGFKPVLYPQLDTVDIEVGKVGIDLKAYVSPELLAGRLDRSIGGLINYTQKWLVIPDRLIRRVPAYLERLRNAMRVARVRVLPASAVVEELSYHA
jgi:hypothetical protein